MSKVLESLKQMERDATQRPWVVLPCASDAYKVDGIVAPETSSELRRMAVETGAMLPEVVTIVNTSSGFHPPKLEDATFIAFARNMMPSLLRVVDAAEKFVREDAASIQELRSALFAFGVAYSYAEDAVPHKGKLL